MKKRPLCLTALLTAFLLLCLPAELFWKSSCLSEGRGAPDFISGEVCGLDPADGLYESLLSGYIAQSYRRA